MSSCKTKTYSGQEVWTDQLWLESGPAIWCNGWLRWTGSVAWCIFISNQAACRDSSGFRDDGVRIYVHSWRYQNGNATSWIFFFLNFLKRREWWQLEDLLSKYVYKCFGICSGHIPQPLKPFMSSPKRWEKEAQFRCWTHRILVGLCSDSILTIKPSSKISSTLFWNAHSI